MKIALGMYLSGGLNKMNCLCCGRPINEDASIEEKEMQWHKKCIKSFFKTDRLPKIDVNKAELESLTIRTVSKGLTVPGVQKKLSLHLSEDKDLPRLTIVDYPTGYILKPQSEDFASLPEAEFYVMKLAEKMGIKTAPCALIKMTRQKGTPYAYITKRIDRIFKNDKMQMLAMEDSCQIGQRLTQEKYKSSYERVAKIIKGYSVSPAVDLAELFYRLVFCFLTGNSDMHLKNFSLIETNPCSRQYVLSPAYDLLPVNVVMPEDTEETALTLNGKKRNITKNDFFEYAEGININKTAAKKMIGRLTSNKNIALKMLEESYMPDDMKARMENILNDRFGRLQLDDSIPLPSIP